MRKFIATIACVLALTITPSFSNIPITFTLQEPGYVTLVIEDLSGKRVRNLIAEMQFPAGQQTVYWDGYDEGTPVVNSSSGVVYDLMRNRVGAGNYHVRGITHKGLKLNYQVSVNSGSGLSTPWNTVDGSGGWMADHSPASSTLFIPAGSGCPFGKINGVEQNMMVLGSSGSAESGSCIIWIDTNGKKYMGARNDWSGMYSLTKDRGALRDTTFYGYALASESATLYGLQKVVTQWPPARAIVTPAAAVNAAKTWHGWRDVSFAINNCIGIVSCAIDNYLVICNLRTGVVLDTFAISGPRGVGFDSKGRLFVCRGGANNDVKRFSVSATGVLTDESTVITGLIDPHEMTIDDSDNIFISQFGTSHQVRMFSASYAPIRTIGKAGGQQWGHYDEARMCNPNGMSVTSDGKLWVAETADLPRRVSVWNISDGSFVKAFYGSPMYGGGGIFDPQDSTRYFYNSFTGVAEFKVDWSTNTSKVANIIMVGDSLYGEYQSRPVTPFHLNGKLYFASGGTQRNNWSASGLWVLDTNGRARHVAEFGGAYMGIESIHNWKILNTPQFITARGSYGAYDPCIWTDENEDGRQQPSEIKFRAGLTAGYGFEALTFNPRTLDATSKKGYRIPCVSIDNNGTPHYAINAVADVINATPGQNGFVFQALRDSSYIHYGSGNGARPLESWKNGALQWSYNLFFGVIPNQGGIVDVDSWLSGLWIQPKTGEAGELFFMQGYHGNNYFMTSDGLFFQTLFGDNRLAPLLDVTPVTRGMNIGFVTTGDETENPTAVQIGNGNVYVTIGKEHSSVFRVDGFETAKRIVPFTLSVTAEMIAGKVASYRESGLTTQLTDTAFIALGTTTPTIDGNLTDWNMAGSVNWKIIDTKASAAMYIANKKLYAAFRTGDPKLLVNSGAMGDTLIFKTGGSLNLNLCTDLSAAKVRTGCVAGDLRLIVTTVGGATKAVLFRPVVKGTPANQQVLFQSPIGKLLMDRVETISSKVTLASSGTGDYEFSIALADLGFVDSQVVVGTSTIGDMGILRGNGTQTSQRIFWNNINTQMTSDVPTEAKLDPINWGAICLVAPGKITNVVNRGALKRQHEMRLLSGNKLQMRIINPYRLDIRFSIISMQGRCVMEEIVSAGTSRTIALKPKTGRGIYTYVLCGQGMTLLDRGRFVVK